MQSKEFREILMIKMRNFDFENGSTDAYIPLANRHRHPYSKHDDSYLYATLLESLTIAIVCGNYFRVFPRNLVFGVTYMFG